VIDAEQQREGMVIRRVEGEEGEEPLVCDKRFFLLEERNQATTSSGREENKKQEKGGGLPQNPAKKRGGTDLLATSGKNKYPKRIHLTILQEGGRGLGITLRKKNARR